jgi:hypothetical protein
MEQKQTKRNSRNEVGNKFINPLVNINFNKKWFRSKNYRNFNKNAINSSFWGGFAVDADFTDGFSGSIEDPKMVKNR